MAFESRVVKSVRHTAHLLEWRNTEIWWYQKLAKKKTNRNSHSLLRRMEKDSHFGSNFSHSYHTVITYIIILYDLAIMILDQQMIWKVMPTQKHAQVLSVQVSCSVVSDSLQPIGLQHTRLLCPSPTPRACSNSLSIELVISSNHLVFCHLLLLLPSIFPNIRNFSKESGVSSSHQVAKVLESLLLHQSFQWIHNISFPLGLTGLISFLSKRLPRVFSNTTVQKHQFFGTQISI